MPKSTPRPKATRETLPTAIQEIHDHLIQHVEYLKKRPPTENDAIVTTTAAIGMLPPRVSGVVRSMPEYKRLWTPNRKKAQPRNVERFIVELPVVLSDLCDLLPEERNPTTIEGIENKLLDRVRECETHKRVRHENREYVLADVPGDPTIPYNEVYRWTPDYGVIDTMATRLFADRWPRVVDEDIDAAFRELGRKGLIRQAEESWPQDILELDKKQTGTVWRIGPAKPTDTEPDDCTDYASADTLLLNHGIPSPRLSEGKQAGKIRSKKAPPGLKTTDGKPVRIVYHMENAIAYAAPKRTKRHTRRTRAL